MSSTLVVAPPPAQPAPQAGRGGTGGNSNAANAGPEFSFGGRGNLLALRDDIKITPVSFRNRHAYVVKDPLSLKYFRWGEKEYRLARMLDGRRTPAELLAEMQEAFPAENYSAAQMEMTLKTLLNSGLLKTDGLLAQQLHHNLTAGQKKMERSRRWLSVPGKLIMFKITLFDPDLVLLRMSKRLAFLWTWKSVAVLLGLMGLAGWLLLRDTGGLNERMPDILGVQNLLIIWFVMIFVKVIHEFGHGLACKHFGGEVHEMGAMFIVLSPFLFCNASDSWTFADKWRRLVVTMGGIYLELFVAAAAACLWVLTPPGFINQVFFNVMLVCSLMTIFFNINPLMKFDGYYALSDLIEVPNLKERSDRALVSRVAGFFTGGAGVVRDPLVERFRWPILTYAVASYGWMFFMAYNILSLFGARLAPYGLDRMFQVASGFVLFIGITAPMLIVGMQIFRVVKNDETRLIWMRVLLAALAIIAVGAAAFFIPVPQTVKTSCVIDGAGRHRITAPIPGFVEEVFVRDGQAVAKGEPLAVLRNPNLDHGLQNLRMQLEAVRMQEAEALRLRFDEQLPSLRALARQLSASIAKYTDDRTALDLTAPDAGTVIAGDLTEMDGVLLQTGSLFCEILPAGSLHAVVVLRESEAGLVEPGQKVSFRLRSLPSQPFHGEVMQISPGPASGLPHQALSQYAGGTVPSIVVPDDPASSNPQALALPSGQVYVAKLALENPDGLLRPGMSGMVKISCGRKALGWKIFDTLRSMIRTDFRL